MTPTPERTAPDAARRTEPTLLYLIKQVELAVRARLDDMVRPAGLTALQYTAMTVLEAHPGLTAARLARHSFVTAQSAADMVNALLARGLIERHRDPADRRRLVLALTAEGRTLLADYRDQVGLIERQMLEGLDDAEVARFRAAVVSCRESLHAHEGEQDS